MGPRPLFGTQRREADFSTARTIGYCAWDNSGLFISYTSGEKGETTGARASVSNR